MSAPYNQVKASSIPGIVLDCVVSTGAKIGGGSPTDNTIAINNWLADPAHSGVNNPTELILDGGMACKGLVLPAAGYIKITGLGYGAGVYTLSGANADPINNGSNPFQPSVAPPAQAGPVYLSNFLVNGNRGNGSTGNSTSGNPRGSAAYWYCNITLYGVAGVYINNMYIYDAPAYSIRLINCSQIWIEDNIIINPNTTAGINNDGIHIERPIADCHINGNYINNNNSDDAIAVNSPEGYASGTIDRVFITNNSLISVLHGLRVYGNTEGDVGSVTFNDNYISAITAGIFIGTGTAGSGEISGRSLICEGNVYQITSAASGQASVLNINSNFGDIVMTDSILLAPGFAITPVLVNVGTVSNLTLNNFQVVNNTSGNTTPTNGIAGFGGTITKCVINGFTVINQSGHSYTAMTNLINEGILVFGTIFVQGYDSANITNLVNGYTNITNIYGPGFQPETNIQSKTGAYTILPTDRTILASTTSGSFAVTLPAKSFAGQKHTIKNTGTTNTLTVTGTVDGSANPTLTTLLSMTIVFDGTSWWKV